ncbi:hypothetical protein L6452_27664 [Arctium lappa]|uniref:Uncharacterized protein n=1 Tax=Arctium lappa TaxID=4217 RepID=A0ACB8ZWX0_ARCLA|nr:hypothetical protein L6452_27664 [Arctium lappa]
MGKFMVGNVRGIRNGIDKNGIDRIGIDGTGNDGIDIVGIGNVGIDIVVNGNIEIGIVGIGIDGIGIVRTGNVVTTVDRCCIVMVLGGGLGKVNCRGGRIDDCPVKLFILNGGM